MAVHVMQCRQAHIIGPCGDAARERRCKVLPLRNAAHAASTHAASGDGPSQSCSSSIASNRNLRIRRMRLEMPACAAWRLPQACELDLKTDAGFLQASIHRGAPELVYSSEYAQHARQPLEVVEQRQGVGPSTGAQGAVSDGAHQSVGRRVRPDTPASDVTECPPPIRVQRGVRFFDLSHAARNGR